eukprot:CAMPEP_0119126116 /NCGR_PEP_ID=MMETSP1310-20130426/5159_1 /TAXON_ID=464262 /ORGANISM="Genus nov. species nov., Strain RCC2339" /LENGTH=1764 /DNA_ID=CAMNT_0007116253 /DNA_START=14 /DNA_END=5308 /DNA_ORIENTATION=-
MALNKGTMDMFLTRALERIHKLAGRKHPKLLEECEAALALIKRLHKMRQKSNGPLSDSEMSTLANTTCRALRLACETRNARIMIASLDCLQKMMAYGYIRESIKDLSGGKKDKALIETVIETISSCFDFPDDTVQLQIIKALLTSITTPSCGVHAEILMTAVRTCYNIYLMSRNQVNQTTSKATLTQMLNIIFARLEACPNPDDLYQEYDPNDVAEQLSKQVVKSVFASVGLTEEEESEAEGERSGPVRDVLAGEARNSLDRRNQIAELALHTTPAMNGHDSAEIAPELPVSPVISDPSSNSSQNAETVYYDCFLIFRALCKLSIKDVGDARTRRTFFSSQGSSRTQDSGNDVVESLDMRSKILALELLLSILENSGPIMRSHQRFITNAIKRHLCVSVLSTNGVSAVPKVFRLSLSIFRTLIAYFKNHLKNEIGVFFEKIFLRILESANSTIPQKWMVLEVLLHICKNPQTLVDIFLNYDCDISDPRDIFERMVNDLAGVAKGKGVSLIDHWTTDEEDTAMKTLGVECMVTIMRSLLDWSKELYEGSETEEDKKSIVEESNDENVRSRPSVVSQAELRMFALQKDHPDSDSRFEVQMIYNQQVKKGKQSFNMKPKNGIKYLINIGHFQNTPKDIANFLYSADGLDKEQVGVYLGGKNDINRRVLYEYVDNHFCFKDVDFDIAIRKFLSNFMLPKEAEQIDRIMEKFAERYYTDNNTIFANADAAYVLAYATIMLATDLHSPAIKKKITLEQFKHNLRKLNDGKDFQPAYLEAIYRRIGASPLKLGFDGEDRPAEEDMLTPKQRQLLFHQETTFMVKKSREILREKLRSRNTFFKSTNIRHVRPMFSVSWCPMLAAFSYMLESTDDDRAVSLCLEGFQCAIRVSSIFYMETEQKAFAKSLANFTLIDNDTHTRQVKPKNIRAIRALLSLAQTDGNYLQDSWIYVLLCVSQLERMYLIGTGLPQPLGQAPPPRELAERRSGAEDRDSDRLSGTGSIGKKQNYEEFNATYIVRNIDSIEIEWIFSQTKKLNGDAIVKFVECLCEVSLHNEIKADSPRTYSLQKLVEVAYENMSRIRLVWSRIWVHIGTHFTTVGCHDNLKIAMYAVDSLRQLSMKFLEKDELSHYNFQKSFLKPFGHIISKHSSVQIRELVVHCLSQMIRSRARNIQSGWKSIFGVFTTAAMDSSEYVVSLSFEMLESIMHKYFELIKDNFFVDCVECIVAHARSGRMKETSLKSLKFIDYCAQQLARGNVIELPAEGSSDVVFSDDNEAHLRLWFPMLSGLASLIHHDVLEIRSASLKELFHLLKNYGNMFSQNFLGMVFRGVILPIFHRVRNVPDGPADSKAVRREQDWISSTCFNALSRLTGLFTVYFARHHFLLHDYLILFSSCILHDNEDLAKTGSYNLFTLIKDNRLKWTSKDWEDILKILGHVLLRSTGKDIYSYSKTASGEEELGHSEDETKGVMEPRPPPTPPTPRRRYTDSGETTTLGPVAAWDTGAAEGSQQGKGKTEAIGAEAADEGVEVEACVLAGLDRAVFAQKRVRTRSMSAMMNVFAGRRRVILSFLDSLGELLRGALNTLPAEQIFVTLKAIEEFTFVSHKINKDATLWTELAKYITVWTEFIGQEREALKLLLKMMFTLYSEETHCGKKDAAVVRDRLMSVCKKEMIEFVVISPIDSEQEGVKVKGSDLLQRQKEEYLVAKMETTVLILNSIGKLPDHLFEEHMPNLYPLFCDLLLSVRHEVRVELRKLFIRVGTHTDLLADRQKTYK